MSSLKIKLAIKLSLSLEREIDPSEITFYKNGCRNDVVRWGILGYECFVAGYESVKDCNKFLIEDNPSSYGSYEIYVVEDKGGDE